MSPESYFKETTWTWKKIENMFVYKYNLVKTRRNSIFYLFNDGGGIVIYWFYRVSALFQYMVIWGLFLCCVINFFPGIRWISSKIEFFFMFKQTKIYAILEFYLEGKL